MPEQHWSVLSDSDVALEDLPTDGLKEKSAYFLTSLYVPTYTMCNGGAEAPSLKKEELINTIITAL